MPQPPAGDTCLVVSLLPLRFDMRLLGAQVRCAACNGDLYLVALNSELGVKASRQYVLKVGQDDLDGVLQIDGGLLAQRA